MLGVYMKNISSHNKNIMLRVLDWDIPKCVKKIQDIGREK